MKPRTVPMAIEIEADENAGAAHALEKFERRAGARRCR